MSMTKRMFEARQGLPPDPARDAQIASDRTICIQAVFERTRPYLAPFVKGHMKARRVDVYRSLYPDGRFPSSTKFYKEVKEAGSVAAYLTHYFFTHLTEALRQWMQSTVTPRPVRAGSSAWRKRRHLHRRPTNWPRRRV